MGSMVNHSDISVLGFKHTYTIADMYSFILVYIVRYSEVTLPTGDLNVVGNL